jgi:hypothetical protein
MKLEMVVWDLKVDLSVKSNNELSQIDLLEKIRGLLDELTSFDNVDLTIRSVTPEEEEEDDEETMAEGEDNSSYRHAA